MPAAIKQFIRKQLEYLAYEAGNDFVALALYDPITVEIRWRVAYGALSERYKGISIRVGKGIAGVVLQTGREMIIESFPEGIPGEELEYPILIIEKLKSAVAVPVCTAEHLFGVLIIGQRTPRHYTKEEIEKLQKVANAITKVYSTIQVSNMKEIEKPVSEYSPFVSFLVQEKAKYNERLQFVLLDQRFMQIANTAQEKLIRIFRDLLAKLLSSGAELLISIERRNEQQMVIEVESDHHVESAPERFAHLMDQVGNMKGYVEMFNEPGCFKIVLNFPIGLLYDNHPWVF
jgi:hypothetical protein